jgi:predicted AAA+ superfamily ATPase
VEELRGMIKRVVKFRLRKLLKQFPAVALLGPRQVGKTTLALNLVDELDEHALYLDLELPSDKTKLADPELYLSQYEDRLIIEFFQNLISPTQSCKCWQSN